jgi:hypothetical protein
MLVMAVLREVEIMGEAHVVLTEHLATDDKPRVFVRARVPQ